MKNFLFIMLLAFCAVIAPAQPKHTFGYKGDQFLLDGKPFTIRSGEMHYPRVPRAYWRDRFRKAKAMGLNTITTYVFWNLHEPKPGVFDFSGNLDVAEFVKEAQAEGLYVILRPGPYVCTEWEFGGLPAWLLKDTDMKVRSTYPAFLEAARRYMAEVGKRLAPLQVGHGGNIIMTQIENEYGSFGSDHEYMAAIEKSLRDAGFDGQLFTSDGGSKRLIDGGTLPDALSVVNLGANDDIAKEFTEHNARYPDVPRMVGEYWVGWFDHWGEKRHTIAPDTPAKGVDWMLSNGYSFNLYMFHGGTTFGFMAGANATREMPIQPTVSSYDYDSPLDEAGRPTKKFFLIRDIIQKHFPDEILPPLPKPTAVIEIPSVDLKENASLDQLLKKPVESKAPVTMESLNQSYGFVLYRLPVKKAISGKLQFADVRDYAVVTQDDKLIGTLDRRLKQTSLDVALEADKPLDILVENMGRINFGRELVDDRKGLFGPVRIGEVTSGDVSVTADISSLAAFGNLNIFSLPLDDISSLKFSTSTANGPAFHRGFFDLKTVGDSFIDTTSLDKGHVWINGHHLGRYWKIGPQQTLYVPAVWLKKGRNEIVVFEVGSPKALSVRGVKDQIFGNQ